MPFNGAGVYSPPNPPTFPAVSGQTIDSAKFNATINDLAAALSQCVVRDGQSTILLLNLLDLVVTGSAALPAGATIGGLVPIFSRYTTGEVISTISPTAPLGTLLLDGKTIGSAASGATGRANSDTWPLYEVLWTNSSNTLLPIQDPAGVATSRGVSASADFAANKRLPLPAPQNGDALVCANSSPVMSRTAGENLAHSHTGLAVWNGDHNHNIWGDVRQSFGGAGALPTCQRDGLEAWVPTEIGGAHQHALAIDNSGGASNKAAGLFLKFYIAL